MLVYQVGLGIFMKQDPKYRNKKKLWLAKPVKLLTNSSFVGAVPFQSCANVTCTIKSFCSRMHCWLQTISG